MINTNDTNAALALSVDRQPDDLTVRSEENEDGFSLTCWQKLRFFLKQTMKDIKRHKCQFCLSFCSVYMVVLSVLIVVSITEKGPLVFFNLAETYHGQWDSFVAP